MNRTLKMLCGILCLLSVVLITLSGCDMQNAFGGPVNVSKGDGVTPIYYGMLLFDSADVAIPEVNYVDGSSDKKNNGNTDNNGNHYGWYKDNDGVIKPIHDEQKPLYVSQNQDVYAYVGISNPSEFQIVSLVINGQTFTSDMFDARSTNEVKIVKLNVGNAHGIVDYTISEIKYADGEEVKDVVLLGNKTAKAGIKTENPVTATVNRVELRDKGKEAFFDITITDEYGLIASCNGDIKIIVSRDGQDKKEAELTVGENEITIKTLNKNKENEYEIVAYYDDLSGEGPAYHTLVSRRPLQTSHAHTWGDWEVTKEASCFENGEKIRTCSACGEEETEIIPAPNKHAWGNWETIDEPSCFEDGEKIRTCSACGEEETEVISAPNKHTFGEWKVTKCGALGESGEKTRTCSVCGETETQVFIDVVEIEWVTTKAVSCIEDGERTRTCPICGETETEIIPAPNKHTFGAWVESQKATCTEDGEEVRICVACGEKETRSILATGHKWSNACDTMCNVAGCGYTRVTEHIYDNACDADCNVCGETRWVPEHVYDHACDTICNVCGYTRVTEHTYDNVCDADCNVCGATRVVLGHVYDHDCDTDCNICGEIRITYHVYDDKYDAICNVCGFVREAECAHKNVVVLPGKEANCIETGLTEGQRCEDCGELIVEQTIIPATGIHNYESEGRPSADYATVLVTYTCSCGHTYSETITPTDFIITRYNRTMVGYTGAVDENLVIPAVFENNGTWYRVTAIGDEAFYYSHGSTLASVTIPDSVTSIGNYAFYNCCRFTSIMIPDSVMTIGSYAFYNCYRLTSITIPDSVTAIGSYAFHNCSGLTSVTIPNSVTTIEEGVFYYCTGLTSITIPESVTTIGSYVFFNCSKLESITIPDSVTTIGSHAFHNCSGLTSVTIPESVTAIGDYMFRDCYNLASITLGESITTIGDYAFYGCKDLASITIPGSVSTIGEWAFAYCSDLTGVTIGNSVTSIGSHAFAHCSGLTSVTIGDYVTTIGDHAFEYCESLTSVTIPNSVTAINIATFYYCTNLTSVTIGNSVTTIEDSAFCECHNLTSVTIGNSVATINAGAFEYCHIITYVYYFGTESEWNQITIGSNNDYLTNATCYYYSETQPTTEGNFWHYVDGVPTVWEAYVKPNYSVGLEYALNYDGQSYYVIGIGTCTDTDLVIPSTYDGLPVTAIGQNWNYVFSNNQNIRSVVIPDTVTYIDLFAFSGCENLESVTLGSNTFVDEMAFLGCTSLKTIHLPGNASVGGRAFDGCTALESITVDNAHPYYRSIDGNLYNKQGTLLIQYALGKSDTIFTLPNGVTEIGHYAFSNAQNLKHIVLADGLATIGTAAFSNCNSLESIIIPASVASIGIFNQDFAASGPVFAFAGCSNLNAVYYEGSSADWNQISLALEWDGTNPFDVFTRYYYSETQPTTEGNFWHYVDGVPTVWEAHKHTEAILSAVAPTCTETGLTEGKYCSTCGKVLVEQIIVPMIDHTYDDQCDTDCNVCGFTREIEHQFDNDCDEICNVAGCGYTRVTYHNYESEGTPSADYTTVIVTYTCSGCGHTYNKTVTPFNFVITADNRAMVGYTGAENENLVIPAVFEDNGTWYRVTTIGDSAFYFCENLTSVTIPDSVIDIGGGAFSQCEALTGVKIGDNVSQIGGFAFGCCGSLKRIDIGKSVAQIALDAFHSCVVLSCIEVDSDNKTYCSIDGNLYTKDGKELVKYAVGKNDTTFIIPDGVETIGVYSVYCSTKITNIVMPDSVISIQAWAFQGCTSLTNVKLSNNIESIGYEAFGDCSSLMTIVIPNSIKTIGGNFFNWLSVLETAYYEGCESDWSKISIEENEYFFKATLYYYSETQPTTEGNYWHYVDGVPTVWEVHIHTYESKGTPSADYATVSVTYTCSCGDTYSETITSIVDFTVTAENRTMVGFTGVANENLVIPAVFEDNGTWYRVTSIGDYAFQRCFSLTSVTIPDSVITIGYSAFCVCTDLTSVTIGDSVTAIGVAAFYRCEGLTNVTIPNSVTTIGGQAFDKCTNLTSVTIGNSVTDIGCGAFESCTNLTSFAVDENNTAYQSINGNLYSKDGTVLVAYAIGKTDTSFAIPNSVTTIGFGAFACCDNLTSVTIPDSVITIDQYAFYKCSNVTGVMIPDSITTIEGGAFAECSNITSVTIGNSVINIDYAAFFLCSNLADVYYTGSESEWNQMIIGYNNDCLTNATRYYYSETQPTTEGNFWHYVDGVPTVWEAYVAPNYSLGLEYTSNGDGTCYVSGIGTCKDADIIIPSTYDGLLVTAIGQNWNYVFGNNQNIRSVVIPDTVTYIDLFAFSGCENLESVTLGSNTFVDEMAFLGCTSLKTIHLPGNASVGGRAFDGCTALESITVDNAHPYYKSIDGNLYNKQGTLLIQYALGKSDTIFTLPNGVTEIGHYALSEAKNLKHIVLADGLTTIGTAAFSNCNSLESIIIPASVASIGIFNQDFAASGPVFAFAGCSNLNAVYYEGSSADWNQISLALEWDGTNPFDVFTRYYYSETQPTTEGNFWHYVDGVTTVWEAHKHTEEILSAVAPTCTETGLTEGKYCSTCGKVLVEQIIVPMIDHTYDDQCDTNCNVCGATRVVPGHVYDHDCDTDCNICGEIRMTEHIYDNACDTDCNICGVTRVVPGHAYDNDCDTDCNICGAARVTHHNYESEGTPSADYATVFVTYTCSGCGDMYSETIAPSNFTLSWETRYMLGYNGEGDGTFIIPACFQHNGVWYRVTEIGYEAFTWEDQFVHIIIPDSVTRIGFYAFNNCGSLTDITIGKGVTHIEWGAFPYCEALKNFTVVEGNIEYYVEGNCLIERSFEAVIKGSANSVIPQGIKMIVHFAFASCENLTQITIPKSVTKIHYNAFDCCFDLTSITFEGTVAEWDAIDKESGWDSTIGNYIVYCTDGNISK